MKSAIPSIILALCCVVLAVMLFQERSSHSSDTKRLNASVVSLTDESAAKDTQIADLTAAGEAKDTQIADLTAAGEAKDTQISELTAAGAVKDGRIAELEAAGPGSKDDFTGITEGKYRQTKRFLKIMKERNYIYTYSEASSGDDKITMKFKNESLSGKTFDYTGNVFFRDKEDRIEIKCWNLISFNASNKDRVKFVCNDLNREYLFVSFYVDERDNSVTASFAFPMPDTPEAGATAWLGYDLFDAVIGAAYDSLAPYAA